MNTDTITLTKSALHLLAIINATRNHPHMFSCFIANVYRENHQQALNDFQSLINCKEFISYSDKEMFQNAYNHTFNHNPQSIQE